MSDIDEAIQEFLIESYENLDQLDKDLVVLEKTPDAAHVAGVFRAVHTLKGSAGFLGFQKLEALAHAGESLLGRVRNGQLTITPDIISTQLTMLDAIRAMLEHVEAIGNDGPE